MSRLSLLSSSLGSVSSLGRSGRGFLRNGRLSTASSTKRSFSLSPSLAQLKEEVPSKALGATEQVEKDNAKKRVVIVGTGWGGYAVLNQFSKFATRNNVHITVISERNHFLFTPLLASTTVGTLEFRSIIEPIRREYGPLGGGHMFDLATVRGVDTDKQEVEVKSLIDGHISKVPYDILVLSVGATTRTFGIKGVAEHAFPLKEVWHARKIRMQILKNFELCAQPDVSLERKKQLLHFVVVGGGPTGVEFSAELHDFVKQDIKDLYPSLVDHVRVTLVEARELLGFFSPSLRAFALNKINKRKEMIIKKNNAVEVSPSSITLDNGEVLPCGLVVWVAGIGPRRLTQELQFKKGSHGQIAVNGFLQVEELQGGEKKREAIFGSKKLPEGMVPSNVFALGDCSSLPSTPVPATAQVAQSQGYWLAGLLKQLLEEERTEVKKQPYTFVNKGMMAYVGDYSALTQMGDAELPTGRRLKGPAFRGLLSWVLWRSVYLTRLGAWRLRMQVPVDWFKTFFFGRDTSLVTDLTIEHEPQAVTSSASDAQRQPEKKTDAATSKASTERKG